MLSLKIAATGLAVAALAWLAIQHIDHKQWLGWLALAMLGGLVTAIMAGLFAVWS